MLTNKKNFFILFTLSQIILPQVVIVVVKLHLERSKWSRSESSVHSKSIILSHPNVRDPVVSNSSSGKIPKYCWGDNFFNVLSSPLQLYLPMS